MRSFHSTIRHLHRQHLFFKQHLFGLGHHTAIRRAEQCGTQGASRTPTVSLLELSQSQPASKNRSHAKTSSIDQIWLSFKSFSIAFAKTPLASTQIQHHHHLPTYLPTITTHTRQHIGWHGGARTWDMETWDRALACRY